MYLPITAHDLFGMLSLICGNYCHADLGCYPEITNFQQDVIVLVLEIRQEIVYDTYMVHKQKNTVQSGVSLLHVNYSTTIRDEEVALPAPPVP